MVQKGCDREVSVDQFARLQVIDNPSSPLPKIGPWHLNEKTVREKLALVKSTTDLELVGPSPTASVFRGWAVVYGQLQATTGSSIALVSSGNGIRFGIDPGSSRQK